MSNTIRTHFLMREESFARGPYNSGLYRKLDAFPKNGRGQRWGFIVNSDVTYSETPDPYEMAVQLRGGHA